MQTSKEFLDWKESNQWFWEFLQDQVQRVDHQLSSLGHNLPHTETTDLDRLRGQAIMFEGMKNGFQQLIDLSPEDVGIEEEADD